MTITPELEACAKAIYEKWYGNAAGLLGGFEGETELRKERLYDVARACLGALLPVSAEVLDAMVTAERPESATVGQACTAEFTAAIRHILGETT